MASLHSIWAVGVRVRRPLAVAGALVCLMGADIAVEALHAQGPVEPRPATFTVFVKTTPIGSEVVSVRRTESGWTISSSGRLGPPLDLIAQRIELRYDPEWKPLEAYIDATIRGQVQLIHTTVADTTARSAITVNAIATEKIDTIDPSAVLLPSPFIAPFEAVAARLRNAAAGSRLAAYSVSSGPVSIAVGESTTEQIQTLARLIQARRTAITLEAPNTPPMAAEVWGDEQGRLLRFSLSAQGFDALREDIAAVSARRVTMSRPNDEQFRVQGNGFSLAGTMSKPASSSPGKPLPAVVLAGGSGPTDRDETIMGIPIFGQIAHALADAGFLVARYDKRGVGQSGGRPESATLADFAEDLRAVVRYMSDRKDVDRRRIAVVGHSEGGALALITAARENRVAALALVGTPGVTGAEVNLYQVEHALDRANVPPDQKASTLDLQKRIQAAVLTGKGWENIPPDLRKQADIPWFQSFLAFDPARPLRDVEQPVLIVQGLLDMQVPPDNADRLEALARGRRNGRSTDVVRVPNVNHLLVPATTGEPDEYRTLTDRNVSPEVISALVAWLKKTLGA
jgi:pimeloyl-ACP methyl ester carboxylesterase